jgi:hypothetical protein
MLHKWHRRLRLRLLLVGFQRTFVLLFQFISQWAVLLHAALACCEAGVAYT